MTCAELGSGTGAQLTYKSLAVKSKGISSGSGTIELNMLDSKGNAQTLKPGKKDVVVVKTFKDSKDPQKPDISALILGGDSTGELAFLKNKIIIPKG